MACGLWEVNNIGLLFLLLKLFFHILKWKQIEIRKYHVVKYSFDITPMKKQRCVEQKGSGNLRSKCLQTTTHTRVKTMTQTLTKHKDKQA